ncbi:MAG: hypothetical protein JW941_00685 [Candidatus Coatesbacteria bacterium]|nr:hypothetical protein [Candidatus Coatesbacteria bacterium]
MKKLALLVLGVLLLSTVVSASWDDAGGRALTPYWQSVDVWYTLLVFVNGSEENYDTIYVRFCDSNGNFCSDTHADMFSIRPGEMLMISTKPGVGYAMILNSPHGYIKYRFQEGGQIIPYALIFNQFTGGGFTVPVYPQDHGF